MVIVATTAALWCCPAARGAESSRQSEGAVRLRWLPDCSPASHERPYFSIEVRDDGSVRYDGYDGTKVKGDRESQIDSASTRRLKSRALSFLRERGALEESEKQFEFGYFCLEVSELRGNEVAATHARRSDARRVRELLREVDKRIKPEKWACPPSSASRGRLDASGYCSEPPAFTLTLAGRTACDITQELFVYESGTVYSLAYRTYGRSDRTERYYEIDPGAVDDLVKTIRPFERAALEVIENAPGHTQKIYYRYQPADVQAIRDRLASLVDIEWLTTSNAADCDQHRGPASAIHLREDLDLQTR
jgi:hypothetical protein